MYKFTERVAHANVVWFEPTERELRNQRAAFLDHHRARLQTKPSIWHRACKAVASILE